MTETRPSATDGDGSPAIDPTKNVRELVVEAIRRQDDLRHAESKLVEAKLGAIAHEFVLVESRRQEQKADTRTAVDAALSAAKDAVKENAITFTTQMQSVTDQLQDVKDRVIRVESIKQGGEETRQKQRLDLGTLLGLFGMLMSIVTLAVIILRGMA